MIKRLSLILGIAIGAAGASAVEPGAGPVEAAPIAAPAVNIPAVPAGHPRVYVRTNDLPGIRAKLAMPEFARAWEVVQRGSAADFKGEAGSLYFHCSAGRYVLERAATAEDVKQGKERP